MSLTVEIVVPLNTILAIQDAAKPDTSPASLQLARNLSYVAIRDAVERLPCDINRKDAHSKVNTAVPGSKHPAPSSDTTQRQTKKVKVESKGVQVVVQTTGGKRFPCIVHNKDTFHELKCAIEELEGIPPMQQRLIWHGKQADDNRMLCEAGVDDQSTIHLVLACRGS